MEAIGKVFRYFSCECGHKFNEFVYRDTSQLKATSKAGVYKVIMGQPSIRETTSCEKCGAVVESSLDPKGARTRFLFNFMEN